MTETDYFIRLDSDSHSDSNRDRHREGEGLLFTLSGVDDFFFSSRKFHRHNARDSRKTDCGHRPTSIRIYRVGKKMPKVNYSI